MKIIEQKMGMLVKYMNYSMNRVAPPAYPDRLYLELTNHCNFQCIMCPNGRGLMKRNKGFMDYELATEIIDEMAPHVHTVVLHIWGESLLHPRIFDVIKYCKKYDVNTELSTNTSLLNEKVTEGILDSGLDRLYLCVDGATKETYEKVRKRGDYDEAVRNVEELLKIKSEKNSGKPSVYLQLIVMKETKSEIDAFRKRWSVKGVEKINIKPLDTWGGQISDITKLGAEEKNNHSKRYHCPNLWYHAHIYWDGTLVCCDRDFDAKYPLENVRGGVMKAWRGKKMQELRRKHIEQNLKDVPSCSNCSEWSWWKPTLFSSWGNIPRGEQ